MGKIIPDNEPLIMRIDCHDNDENRDGAKTMKSGLRSLRTGAAMCAQGKGRDEGP